MSLVKDVLVVTLKCSPVCSGPWCRGASCHLDSQSPSERWAPGARPLALQAAFCSFWDVLPFHPSEDPKLPSCPNVCHMSRTGLSSWAFLRSPPTSMPTVLPWATHQLRLCPGDIVSISGCSNSASPRPRGVVSCSLLVPLLKGEGDMLRAERPPRSHLNQLQRLHL